MNSGFRASIEDVIEGMVEFMPDADYEQADIEKCKSILLTFHDRVTQAGNRDVAMDSVKEAILALNELNAECDDCLIETMEREGICGAIIDLCQELGFNDTGEDVTEDWREW